MILASLANVMTRSPVTVSPQLAAMRAIDVARSSGVDHLVVLEGEELVGIACTCDLAHARPDAPVSSAMSRPPVTIDAAATMHEAAELMRTRGIGCLPVLAGGLLLGIVTRSDLVRAGLPADELRPPCESCGGLHDVSTTNGNGGPAFCEECRRCPDLAERETGMGD